MWASTRPLAHEVASALWVTLKLGAVDLLLSVGQASAVELTPASEDYGITVPAKETARAGNAALAEAASDILPALVGMRAQVWIDDATAI